MLPCELCRQSLSVATPTLPQASLTNCKSRGGLTHPNSRLYDMIHCAEDYSKNMDEYDVFLGTVDHVLQNFDLTFPCREHKNDAVAKILHYYVGMRMRQHCSSEAQNRQKMAQEKKKLSRLAKD